MAADWTPEWSPAAGREYRKLQRDARDKVDRIVAAMRADPFHPDVRGVHLKRLHDKDRIFRHDFNVRSGWHRLVFHTLHRQPVFRILGVGPRKEMRGYEEY